MGKSKVLWRWGFTCLAFLLLAFVLVFAIGGKAPPYQPPYKLSIPLEFRPRQTIRTPYREILVYGVDAKRDVTAEQIIRDIKSQNLSWAVDKPTEKSPSYRMRDPKEPDPSKAEAICIYADPSDPRKSVVQLISPWLKPSRLELWREWTERFIRHEDR